MLYYRIFDIVILTFKTLHADALLIKISLIVQVITISKIMLIRHRNRTILSCENLMLKYEKEYF